MRKSIVLNNGREWKTQKAAIEHFRGILRAYGNGDLISDPVHQDDLVALLERYDNTITGTASKIGSGIDHFERRLNAEVGYSTPGFWVIRTDGSVTDFSFYTAIRGEPKSRSHEFADACRSAVAADLRHAKVAHFKRHADADGTVLCDLSDERIGIDDAHLDHAYPSFGVMVIMFRAAQGWHDNIPDEVLTPSQDAQTTTKFVDPTIAEKFREFHRRGSRLRVISKGLNLSMAARQRLPRIKRPVTLQPQE